MCDGPRRRKSSHNPPHLLARHLRRDRRGKSCRHPERRAQPEVEGPRRIISSHNPPNLSTGCPMFATASPSLTWGLEPPASAVAVAVAVAVADAPASAIANCRRLRRCSSRHRRCCRRKFCCRHPERRAKPEVEGPRKIILEPQPSKPFYRVPHVRDSLTVAK